MREAIHPAYVECEVKCACGNTFKTRSTLREIHLEICSMCHPFFTGKQKLIDTAGRVEKFRARYKKTEGKTMVRAKKSAAPEPKVKRKVKTTDAVK